MEMNIEEKKSEYFKLVNKIFPELSISSAFSVYNGEHPTSAKIELSNQALAFKNKFAYSGSFVHYTSLDSLLNMLNSQEIRLFNCKNLNDKLELKYAVKELGIRISNAELEIQRQNFFIFSACEYDLELSNDDFNLWRLYSNSGSGAAIVFEIENLKDDWKNIFYGKVRYGIDNTQSSDLVKFIDIHQEFNESYRLFENIPSIIPAIGLHFKNRIWSIENEVRFIAYCPFDEYSLETRSYESGNPFLGSTLKHTINKSGKQAAYVTLPLNIEKLKKEYSKIIGESDAQTYLESIPYLKIKRVIVGHKIPAETFVAIQNILQGAFSKVVGYPIQIGYSSFRDLD
jgi:Protein of unknown function (DUF2971)